MKSLGFANAVNVRVGKTITFNVEGADTPQLRESIDKLSHELLSNPVIEDYRFELSV